MWTTLFTTSCMVETGIPESAAAHLMYSGGCWRKLKLTAWTICMETRGLALLALFSLFPKLLGDPTHFRIVDRAGGVFWSWVWKFFLTAVMVCNWSYQGAHWTFLDSNRLKYPFLVLRYDEEMHSPFSKQKSGDKTRRIKDIFYEFNSWNYV